MEQSKGVLGEVRRVHVVYFLCRNGKIEQPHLIRVHHLHRNGVHLRDVKRWLSELRGKDMPETFAWSYKRRYKTGYVWQDLMDDDLITSISDNEYVLKGSDILSKDNQLLFELFSCIGGQETPEQNPNLGAFEGEAKPAKPESMPATDTPPETLQIEREDNTSPQPPPRLDEESPPITGSKPLEGSSKQAAVFKIDVWRQNRQGSKKREELEADCGERRRSYSSGSGRRSSNVFRNLLGCRPMEAADSVQQPIQRLERDRLAGRDISNRIWPHSRSFDGTITHRPKSQNTDPSSSSSSSNININSNSNRKSRSMNGGKNSRKSGDRATSVIYKPVGKPNCSQCGKVFRPDRLHSHMKSCKALRRVWKV